MKIYKGIFDQDGDRQVLINGQPLAPRLDLRNHSPTGLTWGFGGSGPAQLALAILTDLFGDDEAGRERALSLYQEFKWRVISRLNPHVGWTLTEAFILERIALIEAGRQVQGKGDRDG